jgi:hypothetical protein
MTPYDRLEPQALVTAVTLKGDSSPGIAEASACFSSCHVHLLKLHIKLKEYEQRAETHVHDRRYKGSLDRLLTDILSEEGNMSSGTLNDRGIEESDARFDGVYKGQQTDRTRNNSKSN